MIPVHRVRAAGIAVALASLPLLFPGAASANATSGSSDEPTPPPKPGACAGYLWTQDVTSPDAQQLSKSHPYLVIPGLTKPAGTVDVTEVITWDGREHRTDVPAASLLAQGDGEGGDGTAEQPAPELYEKMRVDFRRGDERFSSTPNATPDLPDDGAYAWLRTPLGQTDLWWDADEVVLAHASTFMETDGAENAFYPVSVCITWRPYVSAPAVAFKNDCSNATVTLSNSGKLPAELTVLVNGKAESVTVNRGQEVVKTIPLVEDTTTTIVVKSGNDTIFSKSVTTDCVVNTTTTTAPPATTAPPTTAAPTTVPPATAPQEVRVLAETETAPQLAFTGSDSAAKAGVGAALLGLGVAMVAFGRRRRQTGN